MLWVLDRREFDRVISKAAQLIKIRFHRQPADPLGDDYTGEEEFARHAVQSIFGDEFFEEESVRVVSKKILDQLLHT